MKKIFSLLLSILIVLSFSGCADDSFGHKTYTKIEDYNKIFDLTEIRFDENAFELFPEKVDDLEVSDFYCEWELGFIGSAKVEILLSVNYEQVDFDNEILRLKSLGNGKINYDKVNFKYPAYVSVLGYLNTNYYAIIDEANCSVNYVMLQLINAEDININKDFLPNGYDEFGAVKNISYNIYE